LDGIMDLQRIVRGRDGPVEIDEIKRTVTKTYPYLEHEIAVQKVKRELSHASRFLDALSHIEGVSCPRVLAWNLGAPPRIVMRLCAGEPLSTFLCRIGKRDPRAIEIAMKIHKGLTIYARVFEAPYYDLCFQNILYDEATAVLTFLDFGIPGRVDVRTLCPPLEASLGNLVGSACYEMVRPARLFSPKVGYLQVMRAVVAAFENQVSGRRVDTLARAAFVRLTDSGRAARRNYYKTAGIVVSNLYLRQVKLGSALRSPAICDDVSSLD
jgi:hypothetical protein